VKCFALKYFKKELFLKKTPAAADDTARPAFAFQRTT